MKPLITPRQLCSLEFPIPIEHVMICFGTPYDITRMNARVLKEMGLLSTDNPLAQFLYCKYATELLNCIHIGERIEKDKIRKAQVS